MVGQWLGSFERAAVLQVIAALAGFAILSRVPEDYEPQARRPGRRWVPASLVPSGIAVGLVNMHYPVITGFLILHLAQHGNSGPAAFSAYAGMVLLSRFFLGGLPDRIHPRITFYGGLSVMALGLILIATGPSPALAVTAAAILGFGFSFPWSSVASTVVRRTPERERGSAIGVLSAFYDLFVGMSSFTAGFVANRFGYSAAFVMAATALGAAAIAGRFVFPAGERETTLADAEGQVVTEQTR
jgi:MFS family permease